VEPGKERPVRRTCGETFRRSSEGKLKDHHAADGTV
jgi:hypothetical protein